MEARANKESTQHTLAHALVNNHSEQINVLFSFKNVFILQMDGQETIVNPFKRPRRQSVTPTLVKTVAPVS